MDLELLKFLQNTLSLVIQDLIKAHGFSIEKDNPTYEIHLAYDEILILQDLVSDKIKNLSTKKELPPIEL